MATSEPVISITATEPPAGYPAEILGYVEPWIASPGETVAVKVSSTEPEYAYRLVRVIQGVDLEHAPPPQFEEVPNTRGTSRGRFQVSHLGSYGIVEDWAPQGGEGGIRVRLHFQAHLPRAGHPQALISTLDAESRSGFSAVINDQGAIECWVGTAEDVVVSPVPFECPLKRWVSMDIAIEGRELKVALEPLPYLAEPSTKGISITNQLSSPAKLGGRSASTLLFAASFAASPSSGAPRPTHFFNGRIDGPVFETAGPAPELLARYDFARNIPEDRILDVSGRDRHGRLVHAPTRGVTGHDWDGSEPDWTKAKRGYGAIHFHEDDLDDAGWEADFEVRLPADLRSGVYAFECTATGGGGGGAASDMVTFIVRPSAETKPTGARVAFVLSTFTYLAYANEHLWDPSRASYIEIGPGFDPGSSVRTADFDRLRRRLDIGLSCYDVHADGSGVVYSSARRPIANLRPGYVMWAMGRPRELSADGMFIGFLEREGVAYDVLTDHDLHARGAEALAPYHTVIAGSHPEYPTLESLDAYEGFARRGGNLMYLGGNGFYWAAALDGTARPWRLEVRRADQGVRTYTLPGGERISSLTGQAGGLWRSRGRPSHGLFGVGCCGEGVGPGVPYRRTVASLDPEYAWMFEGIGADELLGTEGLGQGGGASGDEIDSFDVACGSPRSAVVLATSTGHSDAFGIMPECVTFPIGGVLGTQTDEIRSDVVYYNTHAGGAVFSVGSINWFNSLAWNAYNNNIARLTGNVLRGFIRPKEGERQN
ncbi:hypothetical protein DL766_000362 [Monosporascus sp. MC13-8B]|nr:hypothetical protein DL766_000362 [Monosporascus sp. MC13-8B]